MPSLARCISALTILGLLSGCGGVTRTLTEIFVPGGRSDTDAGAESAESIPYASIDIRVGGTGGLLLLTEDAGETTFWRSGQNQVVVFNNGDLVQTTGLPRDLRTRSRTTALRSAARADAAYSVKVSYELESGLPRSLAGQATLDCSERLAERSLPLATLPLRECRERVQWSNGKRTMSTYWLRPDTGRIWEAHVVPWPGAPVVDWKVARPWW